MMGTKTYAPEQRAEALVEALPYIKQFRDAVIVVKYGGSAMTDPTLATTFAEDIVLLRSVGMKPVVVHGGGPQIGHHLKKLGKETRFQDGLRVTDSETLDIVRMILVGKIGLGQRGVTHLHFRVTPLTKDKPATLTAIILRGRALSGPHKAKRQLRRQDVCSSSGVMTPRLAASQRSTSRACTTPTTFPASERTTS
jgi:hypothetical protein